MKNHNSGLIKNGMFGPNGCTNTGSFTTSTNLSINKEGYQIQAPISQNTTGTFQVNHPSNPGFKIGIQYKY